MCGVAAGMFCAGTLRGQENAAEPVLNLPSRPPTGAVVLLGKRAEDLAEHWVQRRTTNPPSWQMDAEGVATPKGGDVSTRAEFGDCILHVEFKPVTDANGKAIGSGNAGVGLQGRYEVQMMNSYGAKPEAHNCASLYGQKAARVAACKPPTEWQTFDIVFRAPRFGPNGEVTEKARVTVFHNGLLVQNNEEFAGPTGIQYEQFKGEAKTGPIVLQGDHDPVQFRNIWIVPL